MDKKSKKKLEVLRKRLPKLRQQLAGATEQMDDPDEVENLKREIAAVEAEAKQLRDAK